jgi:hypothetical protein
MLRRGAEDPMTQAQPAPHTDLTPVDPRQITSGLPVVCSRGGQFGVVDHVEGDSVALRPDAQGVAHFIPLHWVVRADDQLHVDRPGRRAMAAWSTRPF